MFCTQCGFQLPSTAKYCPKCGREHNNSNNSDKMESPTLSGNEIVSSAPPKLFTSKPRWYDSTGNTIGLALLSFFLYSWVTMAALSGATLEGREATYIIAWTGFVFYVMWKQKRWKGWLGGLIGSAAGLAIIFVATVVAGLHK